jgi:hypothetical protein
MLDPVAIVVGNNQIRPGLILKDDGVVGRQSLAVIAGVVDPAD